MHLHVPHFWIAQRHSQGPALIAEEHGIGFNGRLALTITRAVSTMWCAYFFAGLALISLPDALKGGASAEITWLAQTFLQLVLLSIIMVGQKVGAAASDKQALQTYQDAGAILTIVDDVQKRVRAIEAATTGKAA